MDNLKGSIKPFTVYHTDAYMIAVKNGFEGTEAEWLESLKVSNEEVGRAVNKYLEENPVAIDETLTASGQAADAKVTGEAISNHKNDKENPHGVTAEQVGARPDTWMPTAEDVKARPDTWMPTAEDVKARPDTWMPSAEDVGARPSDWMPTASQVGARPSNWTPTAQEVGARPSDWMPTAEEVGATPASHAEDKNNPHGVTPEQIGALSMELLWENASPKSAFPAQAITVDQAADCEEVAIDFIASAGQGYAFRLHFKKTLVTGHVMYLYHPTPYAANNVWNAGVLSRQLTLSDKTFNFGVGQRYGGAGGGTVEMNDAFIPFRIYRVNYGG